ncbi:MAG: hypothetical protein OXC37_04905 [Bdellovibrionaceae bacterium]|nr:hypothetical protein [Pseudobdellovibrionaceae bacterium]
MKLYLKSLCLASLLFCFSGKTTEKENSENNNWVTCLDSGLLNRCLEINTNNLDYIEHRDHEAVFAYNAKNRTTTCSYDNLTPGKKCDNILNSENNNWVTCLDSGLLNRCLEINTNNLDYIEHRDHEAVFAYNAKNRTTTCSYDNLTPGRKCPNSLIKE